YGVFVADELLPSAGRGRHLHFAAAVLLDARRDFELRLGLVVVLPGRSHVLRLREKQRGSGGEDERGGGAEEQGGMNPHAWGVIVSDDSCSAVPAESTAWSIRLISW